MDEKYVLELEQELETLRNENKRLNDIIQKALDFIDIANWDEWDTADYYITKILKGEE